METVNSQSDKTLSNLDMLSNPNTKINPLSEFPDGVSLLESQVAGHTYNDQKCTTGMLRTSTGRVLKPIEKPVLGEREIALYENLQTSQDPMMLNLKSHVPKYYGTTELQIFNKRTKFLVLEDITEGMAEPCVMDVKIGKRTWDPLATAEKRAAEELKYAESKRAYGFSITGFQVYCPFSGELQRFGKDYGKKLDANGVVEALKIFLNIRSGKGPCRQLIVRLLSFLWKVLLFFRSQQKLHFYSSSLLLAYDARRLRHYLRADDPDEFFLYSRGANVFRNGVPSNPSDSSLVPNEFEANSKRIEKMHLLKRSISLYSQYEEMGKKRILNRSTSYDPDTMADRLFRTHSFVNNFDDDIVRMKEDYRVLLNELSSTSQDKQNWVRVNMIDFTHVFPAEGQNNLDANYLEGLENLAKLLEDFLIGKNVVA